MFLCTGTPVCVDMSTRGVVVVFGDASVSEALWPTIPRVTSFSGMSVCVEESRREGRSVCVEEVTREGESVWVEHAMREGKSGCVDMSACCETAGEGTAVFLETFAWHAASICRGGLSGEGTVVCEAASGTGSGFSSCGMAVGERACECAPCGSSL